jgi:hypothetical protein
LTPPGKLLILASVFRTSETLRFGLFFLNQKEMEPAMKKLIALFLPTAFAAPSLAASAGVAPTAANSALAQSGAKIAPPARQSAEDRGDKREHQENTPKDSAK